MASLFRYPVKSMAAESLEAIDVGWNGFAGDRRWAFVRGGLERSGFPWLTIRQNPELVHYQPTFAEPDVPEVSVTTVRAPSGDHFDVVDPALADELGFDSHVIKQSRGIFDATPLSLISAQTVAELGSMVGSELDVRRFRPNILADAVDGVFAEDSWVGAVLRVGGMRMRVDRRDKRCVTINVDPVTAGRDPAVLRAVVEQRQSCLGVYGSVVEPGRVTVGDPILIEE